MQTFKQKQIALAVGSALMIMAGTAQAVVPGAAPIARATKPVLAIPAAQPDADSLYSATGLGGGTAVPVTIYFTAPADGTVNTNFAVMDAGADGLLVNAANAGGSTIGAGAATDDIAVYAGTAGATQVNLQVIGAVFTPNPGGVLTTAANGVATASFSITTSGTEALRVNPATGVMEYSADNTVAAPTWSTVNVVIQSPANSAVPLTNAITANDSSAAPVDTPSTATVVAAVAAQSVFNTMAPTPVVKTRATNGLVDGVTIDTITPLAAAFATGASAAITVKTNGGSTGSINSVTDFAAVPATGYSGVTTAINGSVETVSFATPLTVDWNTAATTTATDAAFYTAADFNTGVYGFSMPFTVAATATAANQTAYTLVYNAATGAAATLTPAILNTATGTARDGAAPIVTGTVYDTAANSLTLTFSEAMHYIGGDDLREIAENVLLGGDSLAALNLNAGGNLSLSGVNNTGGKGSITISGVQTADLTKAVTVNAGISLQESSDPTYSATVPKLDNVFAIGPNGVQLDGGLFSQASWNNNSIVEGATGTNLTSTAAIAPAQFNLGTARAFVGAVATKVDRVVVTYSQAMNVPTAAALAGDIIVTVTGNFAAGNPVQFQFIPTAAQLTAISSTGFTVTLPTALVYANVDFVTGINVQYTPQGETAKVLMTAPATGAAQVVAAGDIFAAIPLSAQPLNAALATMDLKGTVTGAVAGDAVMALLAKWSDADTTTPSVNFTRGKISNPGDKVVTDLALEVNWKDAMNLKALVEAQLASVAKPTAAVAGVSNATKAVAAQLIPVYVKLIRSNDAQPGAGSATSNGSHGASQNYVNARAILSTSALYNCSGATCTSGAVSTGSTTGGNRDSLDPVYEVMLNPVTGAITGKLTGQIGIKVTPSITKTRGLHYVAMDGTPTNQNGAAFAQGVVNAAGGFDFMIGASTKTSDLAGTFVVMFYEDGVTHNFTELSSVDSGAANFVPFSADITRAGTRATLPAFDLAKIKKVDLANSSSWQLVGLGNPARATGKAGDITPLTLPRMFEDTNNNVGNWIERPLGNGVDMAMALAGNKSFFATELTATPTVPADGSTLSTITSASLIPGSAALAFANANNSASTLSVMQAAAPAGGVKLPIGWSLVTVPGTGTTPVTSLGAGVDAVIRVGSQAATQFTWLKSDGAAALPSMTPGEAVFVYSAKGGAL